MSIEKFFDILSLLSVLVLGNYPTTILLNKMVLTYICCLGFEFSSHIKESYLTR